MKFFTWLFLVIDILWGIKMLFFGMGDKYDTSIFVRIITALVMLGSGIAAYYFMQYNHQNGYALLSSLTPLFLVILYMIIFLMTNKNWN